MTVRRLSDGRGGSCDAELDVATEGLYSNVDQAVDTLESAWDSWATLSAAQKDAALKLTVRVVTRLARLTLGRLT